MTYATALPAANAATVSAFGEAVTIAGTSNTGIYSPPFQETNVQAGRVEGYAPTLAVLDAAASGVVHGSTVVVRGKTLYVVGIQPDGTGMTVLILCENSEV